MQPCNYGGQSQTFCGCITGARVRHSAVVLRGPESDILRLYYGGQSQTFCGCITGARVRHSAAVLRGPESDILRLYFNQQNYHFQHK